MTMAGIYEDSDGQRQSAKDMMLELTWR